MTSIPKIIGIFKRDIFYGYFLHSTNFFNSFNIKQAAYFSFPDFFCNIRIASLPGNDISGARQIQLPDFFIKSHFLHQCINERFHLSSHWFCALLHVNASSDTKTNTAIVIVFFILLYLFILIIHFQKNSNSMLVTL